MALLGWKISAGLITARRCGMTSKASYVPEGFHSLIPYLIGTNGGRLLTFLREGFGAEETFRMNRENGSVWHASMRLGDSVLEMGDPPPDKWRTMLAALHLYVPDVDAVYARALEAGGEKLYEPREMEYRDREGGVKDPAGNDWYIATHKAGKRHVPEGLRTVTPGMRVTGAAEFLKFLEKGFAAKVVSRDEGAGGVVAHAKARIGDSVLECAEANGKWGPRMVATHVYVPDCDAVFRSVIGAGASSQLEPTDQSYGERSGTAVDAWGNHWYIATYQGEPGKEHAASS
jgi:PhnB protein